MTAGMGQKQWSRAARSLYPRFLSSLDEYSHEHSDSEWETKLTRLPGLAEDAWLHRLYAPLSSQGLTRLEKELRVVVPSALTSLYRVWNGMTLFFCDYEIWGLRAENPRVPFDVVERNAPPLRPQGLPPSHVAFGSFSYGALLAMAAAGESVILFERGEVVEEFQTLEDLLVVLMQRGKESLAKEPESYGRT
jgi:hypothetical protein